MQVAKIEEQFLEKHVPMASVICQVFHDLDMHQAHAYKKTPKLTLTVCIYHSQYTL